MATETFIIDIRTRGTKKSAADVKRIGTQASQVRKTLAFMRAALVAVAAVRVFGAMTASLVVFSDAMLVVKAVTGATTLEFERMRDVAKGLGATTRFTAGEAAEGMAFLARAGFEVNEVIGALPAVLDLAAAAQLDLGNAADIASNLMTSFGLSVSDLPDIMDTLVFTANNANTTVQQLADGMKLFAPIASQLGIDLKTSAAFMAGLGDAGIQASLAGTGFRRVFTDLEAPVGNLAKALEFMGIAFEEVRPSLVGAVGALQRLKKANVGASAASLLFGKRGGFVAAQMLRGLDATVKFRKELDNIAGTVKTNAKIMEEGLGGALRLVRSALQNLLIAFADLGGETFLNDFFRGLAEVLRAIARNAGSVVVAIKALIAVMVARKVLLFGKAMVLTSVGIAVAGKNALRSAREFGFMSTAATGLRTALLSIPFIAIFTILALLVVGFIAFRNQMQLMGDDGGNLNDVFQTTSDLLGKEVTNAVNAAGFEFTDFGAIVDTVKSRVASAIEGIIAVFFGLIAAIKAIFARVTLVFKKFLLGIDALQLKIGLGFNSLLEGLGLSSFKVDLAANTKEAKALSDEINVLAKEIKEGGTVFENFIQGGAAFLDARKTTTSLRLLSERDAAILATEEANRAAAKARADAAKPKEPVDAGRTDLAAALRGGGSSDALQTLRENLDPLISGMKRFEDGAAAAAKAVGAGTLEVAEMDELMILLARDVVGLSNAEFELAQRQKLINELTAIGALRTEAQTRALRDLKNEAQGTFVSLLNGVSPLLVVNQKLAEIQAVIDDNQAKIEASGLNVADVHQRMAREAFGLSRNYGQVNEDIQALIANQDLLGLSTADLEHEVRQLNIAFLETQRDAASGANRAFLKLVDDATDAAAQTEAVMTDAFKSIEDAVVNFAQTGEISVNSFFRNFAEQLLRLGTQQAIAGIGGFFTQATGGIGGFGASGPSASTIGGIGGSVASLLGFKGGGSFTVGANSAVQSLPGIDNRLIAFRARDNEEVTVTPRDHGGAMMAPVNQIFNIQTKDADSFKRSQSQLQNRALAGINQARRRR